jgi:hypothetical protein
LVLSTTQWRRGLRRVGATNVEPYPELDEGPPPHLHLSLSQERRRGRKIGKGLK